MDGTQQGFLWVLAYFHMRHKQPAKAATLYGVLDVLEPGNPVIMKSLAAAHMESSANDLALAVLDRLEALGEADATTHLLRGKALAAVGQAEAAARAIERFYAARPLA